MKTRFKFLTYVLVALSLTLSSCEKEGVQGPEGPAGPQGEQGLPGDQGPEGEAGESVRVVNYFSRTNLNNSSFNIDNTYTPVGPTLNFEKERDDTKIEAILNSRCASGTLSGANGVSFTLRINGTGGQLQSIASITTSNTVDFLSIFEVFPDLAAGSYELQVYASARPSGSSTGVLLDPGGWGGQLIAKEIF